MLPNFTEFLANVRIFVDFGCLGSEILPQNLTNSAAEFSKNCRRI